MKGEKDFFSFALLAGFILVFAFPYCSDSCTLTFPFLAWFFFFREIVVSGVAASSSKA